MQPPQQPVQDPTLSDEELKLLLSDPNILKEAVSFLTPEEKHRLAKLSIKPMMDTFSGMGPGTLAPAIIKSAATALPKLGQSFMKGFRQGNSRAPLQSPAKAIKGGDLTPVTGGVHVNPATKKVIETAAPKPSPVKGAVPKRRVPGK